MLLRRVAEHVKSQNWTAVSLDFFIVVLGVFVGIQAANWNDEQQARERRAISLDRLHSEAEESVAYLRFYLQYFQRAAEARASVLSHAANGDIAKIQQEDMVLAVNYVSFYPPATPPRSVYDELISAGQFSELGNKDVRDAISQYYSGLTNLNALMSYTRTMSQQWPVWNHPAVNKEFDPKDATTQTHTVVDIEMALGDPFFVKSLQMGHSTQILSMGNWENMLSAAENMCQQIARYLGRSCATIEDEFTSDQAD